MKFIQKKVYVIGENGLQSGWLGKRELIKKEILMILQYHQNPVLEDDTGYYRMLRGKKKYIKTK
jgi:hypothetical protein